MMTIYPTRYQARKHKRADQSVVKVCGGYILMDYAEYSTWKKQQ